MKIEAIDFLILEGEPIEPEWTPYRTMIELPGSHTVRFGHKPFEGEGIKLPARPTYACILRIRTDENLETVGVFGGGFSREQVEWEASTFKLQWEPELVGRMRSTGSICGIRCGRRGATSICRTSCRWR